jgi:hypothetical protein
MKTRHIYYDKLNGRINNIIRILLINIPVIYSTSLCILLIIFMTDRCYIRGILTYAFLQMWSYWIHRFCHIPNSFLNTLHMLHHTDEYRYRIWCEFIELFVIGGGLFIIPNYICNNYFFNNYIIIFWTLMYSSYHMLNYHILSTLVHTNHHMNKNSTNYGPDYMDIIFETKPNIDELESMDTSIINMVIIIIIVSLIHGYFN